MSQQQNAIKFIAIYVAIETSPKGVEERSESCQKCRNGRKIKEN